MLQDVVWCEPPPRKKKGNQQTDLQASEYRDGLILHSKYNHVFKKTFYT